MMSSAELLTLQRGESLNPPPGSKLEMVVNTLREKSSKGEIFVAGPVIKQEPRPGFSEWVDFFVAPPAGVFDAKRLEKFRAGLFPNVQSSNHSSVYDGVDGMRFGFVAFDDHLADLERTTTVTVKVHEHGASDRLKLKTEYETRTTEPFNRRTFVHVVPHPILANVILRIKGDIIQYDYLRGLDHGASDKVLKKSSRIS